MAVEISDRELKRLYITLRQFEQEFGKTLSEILLEIIYNNYEENPEVALEGLKTIFQYTFNSDVDADWFDEEDQIAEVISLKKEEEVETTDD